MSYKAYQKTQQQNEDPRQTEYRLFAQVTKALMDAGENPKNITQLADALDWNRRMWSTFSTDCGMEGNGLPPQLRASIVSLSIWVSKHSSLVMRGEESIQDLININKTIMEGLAMQPAAPQPAPPTDYTPTDSSI
ncbi:flagellar biosynthesis regulatory protein FlaF [Kordiimonas sediminis]|uniref:Flagellar biosynthesis regulatory protein FlaF n=1 Tax=Kordiimonas sediminis TaxID=1735581 RepID=A0A919EA90_9PROT|nr:flagellar biosynthesis regulator FlaF [Kordiimonas sediminis]GHF29545.1 flagellar biosynthesis regulatory protein FlaF [Kordiimonas sediminis]